MKGFSYPALIQGEPLAPFIIRFEFDSTEPKTRLRVAKRLRSVFRTHLRRRWGGYINRLDTDGNGHYEVLLCTTANSQGIDTDPSFQPLWEVIIRELGVGGIGMAEGVPEDASLSYHFVLLKNAGEPNTFSQYDDIDNYGDDESVISIRSHISG